MKKAIFTLLCLLSAFTCQARTIIVDANGSGEYPTIQDAIDDSNDGDVVILTPGTYTGLGNRDIDFNGLAITLRSTDPNDPNIVAATIIDCEMSGRGFYFHSSEGPDSVVAGLTITNGYASRGGGIYCESGTRPTLVDCTFIRNSAQSLGSGMYNSGSSPTLTNCTFSRNSSISYGKGGGMYNCSNSNPVLTNCTFSRNSVQTLGGGMYNSVSNPTLTNCKFSNNSSAANEGGGMYNTDSNPTLFNCTFTKNSVRQHGAGMFNSGGRPTLSNCVFSDNYAPRDGGGMCNDGSKPVLTNCIFSGNSANDEGGGMYCAYGSYPKLTNCTFSRNSAKDYGGGLYYKYSSWKMTNCIFWGNSVGGVMNESTQIRRGGGTGTQIVNYSCIQGWTGSLGGTGNFGSDPCFVDPDNGDHHLLENSPCIDNGDPDYSPIPYEIDIDNQPRVINDRIDIGADEFHYGYSFLGIFPTEFQFNAKQGGSNPKSQILSIQNVGSQILSWEISEDCSWLEAIPANGESAGEIDEVILRVDISGVNAGEYNCKLAITSNDPINSPRIIDVNLFVQGPTIELSAREFEFVVQNKNIDPQEHILEVRNSGGMTLNWEISCDCDWLEFSPRGGSINSGDRNDVTLTVDSTSLDNGTYKCELIVSSPDADNSPQQVSIFLYINPIQFAIDVAQDADTVIVRPGIYRGKYNRDLDFGGKAITLRSTDPNDPNIVAATIIDCNGTEADPHRAFYFNSGEDGNSVVAGFTIKNGYADDGAGVYCVDSSPVITNCNFINGSAENWGGGICCYKSSPLISNCTFTGNSAFEGGAITTRSYWNYLCSPHIENCRIFGNTASGSGGGINSDCLSTPIISNCLITENFAGTYGGGGISIFQSNPTITNCLITHNSSDNSGGGILHWYGFENGSTITNCTIASNSADEAGGIFCSSEMMITNSILWDNSHQQIIDQGTVSVIYSNVQGDWEGIGNVDTDPCFVQLGHWADANDPNIIVEPNDPNAIWIEGDYHLYPFSLCINAGDPDYVAEPNETDLDGSPRIIAGRIDMGAYEFNHIPVANTGPNQTTCAWIDGIADVNLDGSGSYDPDGDELTYLWTWAIEPNTYEANSVTPTIELPVGEHIIELIVNDGADDSEPNYVTITVIEPVESRLWVLPRTINRHSRQKRVWAWLRLPQGITKDDIDSNTPLLLYPGEIEPTRQYIFPRGRSPKRVSIIAYFDKRDLMNVISNNGRAELKLVGRLKTGRYFYGRDTIRIITRRPPLRRPLHSR